MACSTMQLLEGTRSVHVFINYVVALSKIILSASRIFYFLASEIHNYFFHQFHAAGCHCRQLSFWGETCRCLLWNSYQVEAILSCCTLSTGGSTIHFNMLSVCHIVSACLYQSILYTHFPMFQSSQLSR
jgi:hypothetical protein